MTISIQLPDQLNRYIEEQIAKGGYKNADEYFAAVIEAEQHRNLNREIETMLLEAVDGPFSEWTDDDVSDIERVGKRIIARRKTR